jgi:tetratricopeptide (TPR) repeat protein
MTLLLDTLKSRAKACMTSGQWPEARAILEAILRHTPHDTEANLDLADVLFRQGHFQASTAPLLNAAQRLPRNAPQLMALAQHLIARGEILEARKCLDFLAGAPDPSPGLLLAQANLRFSLGEIEKALKLTTSIVQTGVTSPKTLHLHAMLLQFSGKIDESIAILKKCLEQWPLFGDAALVLTNLKKQTKNSNHLVFLQSQVQKIKHSGDDPDIDFIRAEFEYAIFKTLDDLGAYEQAWDALIRCNDIMRKLNPYEGAAEEALTSALVEMPCSYLKSEGPMPLDGPIPIFIVGMPRSGTTLLDRMLSNHPEVHSAGELVEFWRQLHWVADVVPSGTKGLIDVIKREGRLDHRKVGERYLKQTQWMAHGRNFYIDKLPVNIRLVPFIRRALPRAPILHMVRDPMDTCFSNFKAMFGNVSPYSYDIDALAHYYGQYERVVRRWHDAMPGAMLDVNYSDLVTKPAETIATVLAYCRLAYEDACCRPEYNTSPVATPSSVQVRESIHLRTMDQWRVYAPQLERLHSLLEKNGGD